VNIDANVHSPECLVSVIPILNSCMMSGEGTHTHTHTHKTSLHTVHTHTPTQHTTAHVLSLTHTHTHTHTHTQMLEEACKQVGMSQGEISALKAK